MYALCFEKLVQSRRVHAIFMYQQFSQIGVLDLLCEYVRCKFGTTLQDADEGKTGCS